MKRLRFSELPRWLAWHGLAARFFALFSNIENPKHFHVRLIILTRNANHRRSFINGIIHVRRVTGIKISRISRRWLIELFILIVCDRSKYNRYRDRPRMFEGKGRSIFLLYFFFSLFFYPTSLNLLYFFVTDDAIVLNE